MVIVLWIVCAALVLVLTGAVYQHLGSRRDCKRFTDSGRWVPVSSGSDLFLFELGSGEPKIVFESGIGATHLNWRHIQESLAPYATTISYDRAGLGWSSPSRTRRTPANIARELHELLQNAGLEPPFILVGHSFGGLVMRRFALLYPDEVAGVLLIDPMRCEEWPPLDPSKQSQLDLGQKLIRYVTPLTQCGLARLGVTLLFRRAGRLPGTLAQAAVPNGRHVLDRITTEVRKMPRAVWPVVAAHWSRPSFYAGIRSHLQSIPDTVREMHVAEPIHEIPITILTPGNAAPLDENQLEHTGDNVRQMIGAHSAHWIHLDEPALVVESIRTLLDAAGAATALVPQWRSETKLG
ncbi:MAG: alpha/beta hydrolase [Terracidiphilus sp.]|jgi:pimeloyl-ACP methyl ester carboxylesterase